MFRKLGNLPENISDDDRQILEQFVVILYDRFSAVKKVNEERLDLFAHRQKSYRMIPPTESALLEPTKRAVYQAWHVWIQSIILRASTSKPKTMGMESGLPQLATTLVIFTYSCYLLSRACKMGL